MAIQGYDLRERPWQPGLDDARFNQQPRNPNFSGGASPEATAYQRANDLRGMAATERPFTQADARTFGTASTPAAPAAPAPAAPAAKSGVLRRGADMAGKGVDAAGQLIGGAGTVASKVVKVGAPALGLGYSTYAAGKSALEGEYGDAGLHAADAAASAGLMTGVGTAPAAAWLGARGVTALANDWLEERPGLRDAIGGTVNQIGLNTGLWGADDSALLQSKAAERLRAPAQPQATPAAAPTAPTAPAQTAGAGTTPNPSQTAPTGPSYGPVGDRTTLTNEQASIMNPQGRITAVRQPNGTLALSGGDVRGDVSYHDASGKPLPGGGLRGKFADFQVAPAGSTVVAGPNGSYAFGSGSAGGSAGGSVGGSVGGSAGGSAAGMTPSQAAQYNAEVERARAINADEAARNNSPAARMQRMADPFSNEGRAMRNLRMDIDSSMDRNGRPTATTQALMRQYEASAGGYLGEPAQERMAATERYKADQGLRGDMFRSQTTADASRYAADQNLRGDIFKTTASAGNAYAQAQRDAEKYATDRRDKATERLDKVFGSYATVDGKVDEGRLAALRNNAQAFVGTAIDAARKRGDEATARQLEREGLTALADDPSLMQKYAAAMKLDAAARRGNGGNYVGTDNPGARVVSGVTPRNMVGLGGEVVMSDGTRVPRNRVEYDPNSGILPNGLAHIDPWSNRTTEYDPIDPRGLLRKGAQ